MSGMVSPPCDPSNFLPKCRGKESIDIVSSTFGTPAKMVVPLFAVESYVIWRMFLLPVKSTAASNPKF